jgi:type I restriction enzyme S subunit
MPTETAFKYLNEVRFLTLSNWSVGAILSDKVFYKDGFKLEPIGNLIIRNREKQILEDDKAYKQVTIKLYGKGLVQRGDELIFGKDIGTKNQFRISEGQFIMSKIDARNGAFGIVPAELDGAITTQDFLSYNINKEKILPEFFNLIAGTKHFAELCQKASSGTTGRQRVDEKAFLGFRIPVPKITTQKSICETNSQLKKESFKLIQEAENIQNSIQSYVLDKLGVSQNNRLEKKKGLQIINFKNLSIWSGNSLYGMNCSNVLRSAQFPNVKLSEVVLINPRTSFQELEENQDLSFLPMANISDDYGEVVQYDKGQKSKSKGYTKFQENDLLWARITPCMQNGKSAIARKLSNGFGYGSTEYHVIRHNDQTLVKFIYNLLRLPILLSTAEKYFTGTAGQQRVPRSFLEELIIPKITHETMEEINIEIQKKWDEIKSKRNKANELGKMAETQFESAIFNID